MRVVLATFGTAGDVGPFITLAQALLARGHQAELVTDVAHQRRALAAGVQVRASIARYDPVALTREPRYADPNLGPYRLWRDVFVPLVPELYAAVSEALAQPTDVVLVHPWCFGALYAAEVARVPAASVAMASLTWWSAEDPGLYSHLRPPAFLHRALLRGPVRWILNGLFGRDLTRARAALGLPRTVAPFFALGRAAEAAYGLWSPLLRGPAKDDPRGAQIAGFLQGASTGEGHLPAELAAFLEAGPPPVVVGVGSLLPPMAGELYSLAKAELERRGMRAVLVGAEPSLAGDATCVVPAAPYALLFRRARLVIHHGGAGTLAEACHAGRPQLVVPFGNDQYDNAWRVERLGVAQVLPRLRLTPRRFAVALDAALGAPAADAATALAAALAQEPDGATVVVTDLERRFGRPSRPPPA